MHSCRECMDSLYSENDNLISEGLYPPQLRAGGSSLAGRYLFPVTRVRLPSQETASILVEPSGY